jgi:hypothetical protein
MPSFLQHPFELLFVVVGVHDVDDPVGPPLQRHVHQQAVPVPHQHTDLEVTLYLRELRVRGVDDMASLKLCAVLIETISEEHRNVIEPRVARRGR